MYNGKTVTILICSDYPVRAGAAPRVLPQGDVELHGPHSRLLRHHLLHNGYDVRLCFQYIWAIFFTMVLMSGGLCFLFIRGIFYTLIKKKKNFFSYIRKSRRERLQSHIWITASSFIICAFPHILGIRKPFLIYDFATAPFWISLYMRKMFFFFISAWIWHKTVFSGNSPNFTMGMISGGCVFCPYRGLFSMEMMT